ncbi:hypothetical protein predicted by Glimmer/Critica [Salmonella enterica subsp. enterica serovar Weltevreden str. 2007-60-3289-1]|nr:hypothetical protein predicted by Glimmer/Critica [Salmonella enterica subsp. enterica serovar Weltevreden str. 2007-60-3289-1]
MVPDGGENALSGLRFYRSLCLRAKHVSNLHV